MRDRLDLPLLLVGHAGLLAALIGRGSPWATASIDCVTPTLAEIALSEPAWTVGEAVDSVVGGQAVAAMAATPFYALAGTGGGVGKVLAVALSVGLVAAIWALLRPAGRGAAAVGAGGVAFASPLVVHSSTILGNWHYAQLVFDYGAVLLVMALLEPRVRVFGRMRLLATAAFGLFVGAGLLHSPGSLPFLGASCLLLFAGRVRSGGGIAEAGVGALGFVVGSSPLWWRLAAPSSGRDPTLSRLLGFRPDLDVVPGLVHPDLPWALHMHDLAPPSALVAVFSVEAVVVTCLWLGFLLSAVWLARSSRSGAASGRALLGVATPVLFVLVFVFATVLLGLEIERLPARYTNVREHTHRVLPPLLVALAAAAGPGWAAAWSWSTGLGRAGAAVRVGVLLAAAAPPVAGGFATLVMIASAPGGGVAYRGACFDVVGFKVAGMLGVEAARERCAALSTPGRRQDCLAGTAWGAGYHSAIVGGTGPLGAGRCARIPPDMRSRCRGWTGAETPVIHAESQNACASLSGAERDLCGLGVGWFVSGLGRVWTEAPLVACESFGEARDRAACWRGPGFAAADHLSSTPRRLAATLGEIPPARRSDAARGAGYSIGRTYARSAPAIALCDDLGEVFAPACRAGVADAARHTLESGP